MQLCGIFATNTVLRGTHWVRCGRDLKTKTLNIIIIRSCLQLLQIEVTTFGRFLLFSSDCYLAQDFSCSVKTVECGQIFLLACMSAATKKESALFLILIFFVVYLP